MGSVLLIRGGFGVYSVEFNRKSPYEITLNNGDFDFTTDSGTRYKQTAESLTGEKP